MTTFEDRERAFEAKYAHDEEFRFRMTARRDKLFAEWAADQVHLPDEARAALIKSAFAVDDRPGHDDRLIELMRQKILVNGGHLDRAAVALALQQSAEKAVVELLDHPEPRLA